MLLKEFSWKLDNGTWERSRILPVQEYKTVLRDTDFHSSIVTFTTSEYYYGEMVGNFVLDFDDSAYPENARMDALVIIESMKPLGVKETDWIIKFSGSKGFHLELPYKKFLKTPDLHLIDIFRLWAEELKSKTKFNTLDMKLYIPKRTIRFPNTINSKSGLYCRYITYEELCLPFAKIKELAVNPGKPPKIEDKLINNLSAIYERFKTIAENDWKRFKVAVQAFTPSEKDQLPCIQALLKDGAGHGERNSGAYILACYGKKVGKTAEGCAVWIAKEYCHSGDRDFSEKEIKATVNSAYRSHKDGIGCNNYLMKMHCDKGNCILHNKLLAEDQELKSKKMNDTELSALVKQRQDEGWYDIVLKTGISKLDELMPIRKSDFLCILAPPGSGKTTLMFNFLKNIAFTKKVLYFPLEEDELDTADRKKNLNIQALPNLDYYGIDLTYVDIPEIEKEMASRQYDVIFIDQLNKVMLDKTKSKSQFREYFTNVVIELRRLTKQYKIPIFVLHQLGRGWEDAKHPSFSLFKETAAIEEEATRILCFWSYRYNQYKLSREPKIGAENQDLWDFEIYIMKGRGMGINKVPVKYDMRRGVVFDASEFSLPFEV